MDNSLPKRYGTIHMTDNNSNRRTRPSVTSSAYGNGNTTPSNASIERMRTRLQFYNMNPLEKWETKKKFPYKLLIQVIKIIFVTLQVRSFLKCYLQLAFNLINVVFILVSILRFLPLRQCHIHLRQ